MDDFNYLAVLVSIILGLGITQLLTGVGRLVQARSRVREYWPAFVWVGILLLLHVQMWWALFGWRDHQNWNFFAFLVVLLLPVDAYLLSALVLPDPGTAGAVDLRTNYYAQVRWFFTLLAALPLLSLLQELLLGERVERDLDTGVRIALAALAGTAAITRREWYHQLLAPLVAVILLAYVLVLFRQLP